MGHAHTCGVAVARAKQTFDRAVREDDPAWLAYFDEAYLAVHMAQCFRDLGETGHAARSVRYVRDLVRILRPQADVAAVRDFTAEVPERLPAAAGHAAPR